MSLGVLVRPAQRPTVLRCLFLGAALGLSAMVVLTQAHLGPHHHNTLSRAGLHFAR